MKNRVALVTGGMGGIGTAIAECIGTKGIKVVVSYNKGGNHALAEEWQTIKKQQGNNFEIVYCDISDFESSKNMITEIEQKMGPIDILVNNAGITEDTTLMKMTFEQWSSVINTNLNGIFNVSKHVLPKMIEKKFGRIINISSINAQKGQFGQTNYCASKAGIHGFTKALAQEVAKKGITVNTISPGYVKTPMIDRVPNEILDNIIKQIPIGRLAMPKEIAHVVAFLADDEAAYITGANIAINGGQHMY